MTNIRPAWISLAIIAAAALGGCVSWLASNGDTAEAAEALGSLDCPTPLWKGDASDRSESGEGQFVGDNETISNYRYDFVSQVNARRAACTAVALEACHHGELAECHRAVAFGGASTHDFRLASG